MSEHASHWGFIIASYAVSLLVPALLAIAAARRLARARARLAAIDPRQHRA